MTTNANFDDLAADYDRFRTGYAPELFDLLVNEFGFQPGSTIVDAGIGTGLAAEPLLARGLNVVGVDPSAEMLAAARTRFPQMTLVQGSAEHLPLESATYDGAISAQAFHWFDQPAAFAELIRVVKPQKPIAVWWKILTSDDRVRTFRKAACAAAGLEPPVDPLRGGFKAFYGASFESRSLRVVPHLVRFTVAEWMGYERSRANARNAYGERRDAYLEALEGVLLDVFGNTGARFDVRYVQYLYVGITA